MQTSGGPEAKATAFRPASTIARSLGRAAHHRRPDEEARLKHCNEVDPSLSLGQPGQLPRSAGGAAMTDVVNIYDAKTNLSKLVERAAAGEEIIIAKAG